MLLSSFFSQLTSLLFDLLGCKVLSAWWNANQIGADSLGSLASVDVVEHLNGAYLHLRNPDSSAQTQTLVVAVPSTAHLPEAQVRPSSSSSSAALVDARRLQHLCLF